MTEFVHFSVEGDRFAVSLAEIGEIARISRVTPVPGSPASIRGLANVRGRVVTLVDAESLYALHPGAGPAPDGPGHALVFAPPRDHLALFTRSRVDVGRGQEPETASDSTTAAAPAGRERQGIPLGRLVLFGEEVVHLIPAADLAAHCEAQVLERYRRRV